MTIVEILEMSSASQSAGMRGLTEVEHSAATADHAAKKNVVISNMHLNKVTTEKYFRKVK